MLNRSDPQPLETSEKVPLKDQDALVLVDSELAGDVDKHGKVLDFCLQTIIHVALIGFFETFCANSRSAVWILYARQFESSTFVIAAMKCIGMYFDNIDVA